MELRKQIDHMKWTLKITFGVAVIIIVLVTFVYRGNTDKPDARAVGYKVLRIDLYLAGKETLFCDIAQFHNGPDWSAAFCCGKPSDGGIIVDGKPFKSPQDVVDFFALKQVKHVVIVELPNGRQIAKALGEQLPKAGIEIVPANQMPDFWESGYHGPGEFVLPK